jgi:hypothetical protein
MTILGPFTGLPDSTSPEKLSKIDEEGFSDRA